jgi:hypothetical protein
VAKVFIDIPPVDLSIVHRAPPTGGWRTRRTSPSGGINLGLNLALNLLELGLAGQSELVIELQAQPEFRACS